MTTILVAPTAAVLEIVCTKHAALIEWSKETNCAYPDLPETINLDSPQIEIAFPDEASATLFKLRWL